MKHVQRVSALLLSAALLSSSVSTAPAATISPSRWAVGNAAAGALLSLRQVLAEFPSPFGTPIAVHNEDSLKAVLAGAMRCACQPPVMDVGAVELGDNPAITVKNLYFTLLSEYPELKYAYDLTASVKDGLLTCQIQYMPYKTGDFPEEFAGSPVSSLSELIAAAEKGLGQDLCPIQITNPDLNVDDLSRALQQAGDAEIVCTLNRDATAIVYAATDGRTMEACFAQLTASEQLAQEVVEQLVPPGTAPSDAASILYGYLTEHVRYDFRYYSDRANMPHESMTAYGALHDQLAICGGYALALQQLLQAAGIPCYTVSGTAHGEGHMWNIAQIDGQWKYFDATADRGRQAYGYLYFNAAPDVLTGYTWNQDAVDQLTAGVS